MAEKTTSRFKNKKEEEEGLTRRLGILFLAAAFIFICVMIMNSPPTKELTCNRRIGATLNHFGTCK